GGGGGGEETSCQARYSGGKHRTSELHQGDSGRTSGNHKAGYASRHGVAWVGHVPATHGESRNTAVRRERQLFGSLLLPCDLQRRFARRHVPGHPVFQKG